MAGFWSGLSGTLRAGSGTITLQGGMGKTNIWTSRGVMTGHDARRTGVGGELVSEVW